MEPKPSLADPTNRVWSSPLRLGNPFSKPLASGEGKYPSPVTAAFVMFLLILASVIAYLDVQVFAVLLTPIKAALGLSDARLGLLQGMAFYLAYGIGAFPAGRLIDRRDRTKLLMAGAIGWGVFTILSGLSFNFWTLFLARMGVGLSEAGLYPAIYSLIADLYPPARRPGGYTIFFAGALLGASGAISLSGLSIELIAAHARELPLIFASVTPWRLTFFAASIPALVLALLFVFAREPCRQQQTGDLAAGAENVSFRQFTSSHWRSLSQLIVASVGSGLGAQALLFWAPTILSRSFGLSGAEAGEKFGLYFGIGSIAGVVLGAALSRYFYPRWGVLAPLQALKVGAALALLTSPLMLFARTTDAVCLFFLIHVASCYVSTSITPNLLASLAPNHLRAQVFTLLMFVATASSIAWPPLIGFLSDQVFHGRQGLLFALCAVVIPCNLIAPFLLARIVEPARRMLSPAGIDAMPLLVVAPVVELP